MWKRIRCEIDKSQKHNVPKDKLDLYFKQIIMAVQQCHQHDIIHRDIKIENILVDTKTDHVVLIDFGISVPFQSIRKPDDTNMANTITYRPPECLFKNYWPYDQKIDIWAMGCVFYYMITKTDFVTQNDVLKNIFQMVGTPTIVTWPELNQLNNNKPLVRYPGKVDQLKSILAPHNDLVLDCLTINPHDRPTATQLLEKYYK